jgi:hypothetical protein
MGKVEGWKVLSGKMRKVRRAMWEVGRMGNAMWEDGKGEKGYVGGGKNGQCYVGRWEGRGCAELPSFWHQLPVLDYWKSAKNRAQQKDEFLTQKLAPQKAIFILQLVLYNKKNLR